MNVCAWSCGSIMLILKLDRDDYMLTTAYPAASYPGDIYW
jgi:hypothetical protein